MNNKDLPKRFFRSSKDSMIAGVAGGLASYFNIDPILVRLGFVFLTIAGGFGFLIYLLLWLFTPLENYSQAYTADEIIEKNAKEIESKFKNWSGYQGNNSRRYMFGGLLVLFGFLFLISNLGFLDFGKVWPVILIIIGLIALFKHE